MLKDTGYYKNELEEYGEIFRDENIICPYCLNKQLDLNELQGAYKEGIHKTECEHCEKEFNFETHIIFRYTTKCPEED